MIPAEAVEAAAKIVYRTSGRKRVMSYEQARPACEDDARSILEAAAPYIQRSTTSGSERDELAELIWRVEADQVGTFKTGITSKAASDIADAILNAGYRKTAK